MHRPALLAALALVGAVAFAATREAGFDGVAWGALLGAAGGGAVGLLSHGFVRLSLQRDTQAAFQAILVGFAMKFLGAVLPWAALVFLPESVLPLRADGNPLVDPTAFLLTYALCVLLVLAAGVVDTLRVSNDVALDAMERARDEGPRSASSSGSNPLESAS